MARLKPEFARGKRERTCHLFPLPSPGTIPTSLRAYCGRRIAPGQAELIDDARSAPCVTCMLLAPPDTRGNYPLPDLAP